MFISCMYILMYISIYIHTYICMYIYTDRYSYVYISLFEPPSLCGVASKCVWRQACLCRGRPVCEVSCARADIRLCFDSTCLDCTFTSKQNLHKYTASAGREEGRGDEVEGGQGLGRETIRDKLSEDHPDHGARSAPQPKGQEERKPLDKQVGWYRHQRLR